MSLYLNSSQEETFQTIMDYFRGRRYKILVSNSPSLIRAEFGSWHSLSVSSGTAKGEAEATIIKRNGGSYVNFNFSFMKEYLSGLIVAVVIFPIVYLIAQWFAGSYFSQLPASVVADAWGIFNPILIFLIMIGFALIMSMEGLLVSKTRKRFIEEFNVFAQSLSSKK